MSAIVHFDEVHFPKSEFDEAGKWIRDLTEEESIERAYIPVHMHICYIPLSKQVSKDGIEYLKLDHNSVWKGDGCKYWQTFTQFNDKCYEKLGKIFDVNRGEVWEDWKDRTTSTDEVVKKQRKLNDYKKDQEEARLQGMLKKAKAEYKEAVEEMNNAKVFSEMELVRLKNMLHSQQKQIAKAKKEREEEIAKTEKLRLQEQKKRLQLEANINQREDEIIEDVVERKLYKINEDGTFAIDENGNYLFSDYALRIIQHMAGTEIENSVIQGGNLGAQEAVEDIDIVNYLKKFPDIRKNIIEKARGYDELNEDIFKKPADDHDDSSVGVTR